MVYCDRQKNSSKPPNWSAFFNPEDIVPLFQGIASEKSLVDVKAAQRRDAKCR
jgi:hypothetical protein